MEVICFKGTSNTIQLNRSNSIRFINTFRIYSLYIGTILLMFNIFTHLQLAQHFRNSYWTGDSKEIFATISFAIYIAIFSIFNSKYWTGKHAAWFSISGFILVIFTYFGVNKLMHMLVRGHGCYQVSKIIGKGGDVPKIQISSQETYASWNVSCCHLLPRCVERLRVPEIESGGVMSGH